MDFSVSINAEKILSAEAQFYEYTLKIASIKRQDLKNSSFFGRYDHIFKRIIFLLCALGTLITLLMFIPFGYCRPNYGQAVFFLTFFIMGFVFLQKEQALRDALWNKLNRWVADTRAAATFKIARRLAAFEAHYTIIGNNISYSRAKDGMTTPDWTKPLSGEFYVTDDFVIVYKSKQLYPYVFIWTDSGHKASEVLEGLGLKKMSL